MAGVRVVANTGDISFATATKTIMQLVAAANHRIKIERIRVSFKGQSGSEAPVLVELLRQSTAGTMTSLTLYKANDSDDETIQTTAQHTATAEPTAGDVIASQLVHPQAGYDFVFLPGRELFVKGGGRLGVRVNTPMQAGTIDVSAEIEE